MEPDTTTIDDALNKSECAVCLQPCVQPVQLPCRHIFCYLCVKGVTHQSKRCAMCRQEIPANYLDNPNLIAAPPSTIAFEGSYQWFYEGRNGWWQYDDRTSSEIEAAFKKGDQQCEVLIAGFLYIIDFQRNVQVRRSDPSRRRHIKRDLVTISKKGVAGIRNTPETVSSDELSSSLDGNSAKSSTGINRISVKRTINSLHSSQRKARSTLSTQIPRFHGYNLRPRQNGFVVSPGYGLRSRLKELLTKRQFKRGSYC